MRDLKEGDWVTNNPKTIKNWWPRRMCHYVEGEPKETNEYSVEDFKEMGYIGIYVGYCFGKKYKDLPLVKNAKEYSKLKTLEEHIVNKWAEGIRKSIDDDICNALRNQINDHACHEAWKEDDKIMIKKIEEIVKKHEREKTKI